MHIVLTRFNCRFVDRDFPARTQQGWLDNRFDLFERYCLPTLKAQSSRNFEWLIYLDAHTPESYVKRAESLIDDYPNFHLRFLEFYTGDMLKRDLEEFIGDRVDWLITTRLDNDDGLNADFVQQLQSEILVGRHEALNFPKGVVLGGVRSYISRQASNAFLSLSESRKDFQTVLCAPHKDMHRHAVVRNIDAVPMWLQVIHDGNVSNKLRGRRVLRSKLPAGFDSVVELANPGSESRAGAMIENLVMSAVWAGRDSVAHIVRNIRGLMRNYRGGVAEDE